MKNILTFIIPVRHQDNAKDWALLKKHLSETIASIANQTVSGWKVVIVANEGADLPTLPAGFEVKRVTFPPNAMHEQGAHALEDFREAVRLDKGRRILAGMLHAGDMGHAMVVDDDDFISRRLTEFVAANPSANGWTMREGYIWSGGDLLYRYGDFSKLCGTSHIIRADLFKLPKRFEDAAEAYISRTLGSHVFIEDDLRAAGTPLAPLPFAGAVYRTGHNESHSRSEAILKKFLFQKDVLMNPLRLMCRALRLRWKSPQMNREFFGGA